MKVWLSFENVQSREVFKLLSSSIAAPDKLFLYDIFLSLRVKSWDKQLVINEFLIVVPGALHELKSRLRVYLAQKRALILLIQLNLVIYFNPFLLESLEFRSISAIWYVFDRISRFKITIFQ